MSNLPDVQLIFVTGALDREAWRHQEKYFSRSCRVEVIGGGKFGEVREELEDMLDNCDNAVVIGAEFGNYVVKSLEGHEGVMSTVFTGLFENFPEVSERKYRYMKEFMSKPKIFKKLFFREKTDYRIIKKFLRDIKLPDYEVYSSYSGLELDVPLKNSLTVYNQSCRFSKMSKIEEMRSNSEIAIIDGGTFSFYERPQEFNKALHDYLQGKSDYLNRRELVKAAQENQSLKDFNSLRVKQ
jgi:hypothetical protein